MHFGPIIVLIILGNSSVIYLFIALLIPLRPLVGLRPPSKIPSSCYSASLYLLHLCLLLSNTPFQKAFSHNAGATKGVPRTAAHRGIWYGAGATKS